MATASRSADAGGGRGVGPGVDCRPANGSLSAGNIRRILYGIFEMPCVEWYTSVDSRRLST
eukprot:1192818-Prorocentrum_minimum.AAC.4